MFAKAFSIYIGQRPPRRASRPAEWHSEERRERSGRDPRRAGKRK